MSVYEQTLHAVPQAAAPARTSTEVAVRRAEKLARLMDDAYLDPLVGLALPGAGDIITLVPSLYIVFVGWRNGVPKVVLARMLLNLALDTLAGSVPVVGDLFDAGYKANKRNAALLRERQGPESGKATDWLKVGGALALFLGAQFIPIAILVGLIAAIF